MENNFDLRKFLTENKLTSNSKNISEVNLPKDRWVPIPSSELKDYEDEIFKLISTAYAPIGGHPNYRSAGDVTGSEGDAEYEVIDLDDDPEPDALAVSKIKPAGRKFTASGHDNSKAGKSQMLNHKAQLLKKPGHYVEVSGKMKDIMLGKGVEPITDEETVRKVLKGKEIEWLGDGEYRRMIGGEMHTKMLMGKPNV